MPFKRKKNSLYTKLSSKIPILKFAPKLISSGWIKVL